jgi:hypothetical protein
MKRRSLYLAATILSAGMLTGCSSGPDICPTDCIARWGQEAYYGRGIPCYSDGHPVYVPSGAYVGAGTPVHTETTSVASPNYQTQGAPAPETSTYQSTYQSSMSPSSMPQ